jgi:hypothetical protein
MAKTTSTPYTRENGFGRRKRRTRQHVIADQSVNHVERFIIDEGHTAQRIEKDYGFDLLLFTFDEHGYVEPGFACLQLKATESLPLTGSYHYYDLDIRDYNLWIFQNVPVILILYDAIRRKAYWVDVQQYFADNPGRRPEKGAKSIRVRVPRRQVVNRRAIANMRALKWQSRVRLVGEFL